MPASQHLRCPFCKQHHIDPHTLSGLNDHPDPNVVWNRPTERGFMGGIARGLVLAETGSVEKYSSDTPPQVRGLRSMRMNSVRGGGAYGSSAPESTDASLNFLLNRAVDDQVIGSSAGSWLASASVVGMDTFDRDEEEERLVMDTFDRKGQEAFSALVSALRR